MLDIVQQLSFKNSVKPLVSSNAVCTLTRFRQNWKQTFRHSDIYKIQSAVKSRWVQWKYFSGDNAAPAAEESYWKFPILHEILCRFLYNFKSRFNNVKVCVKKCILFSIKPHRPLWPFLHKRRFTQIIKFHTFKKMWVIVINISETKSNVENNKRYKSFPK